MAGMSEDPIEVHVASRVRRDEADLAAVTAVVARLEQAQQAEDVDGFLGLFAPDPVWTTGGGRRLKGIEEIAAFTRRMLPGAMRESTQRYDVERIAVLADDVAVVSVRQRTVTLAGEPIGDAPEGRPTYVMTREGGEWRIAAGQNTLVQDG
jgi:uncharacterized protein (TIGR02246 family)